MTRNILAAIGLAVVAKKGFEFYCHYQALKREADLWRNATHRESRDEARLS